MKRAKTITAEEAYLSIKRVCDWLEKGAPGGCCIDEEAEARDMCYVLLDAANCYENGGCKLCGA